jgi:hypothetical protein
VPDFVPVVSLGSLRKAVPGTGRPVQVAHGSSPTAERTAIQADDLDGEYVLLLLFQHFVDPFDVLVGRFLDSVLQVL